MNKLYKILATAAVASPLVTGCEGHRITSEEFTAATQGVACQAPKLEHVNSLYSFIQNSNKAVQDYETGKDSLDVAIARYHHLNLEGEVIAAKLNAEYFEEPCKKELVITIARNYAEKDGVDLERIEASHKKMIRNWQTMRKLRLR